MIKYKQVMSSIQTIRKVVKRLSKELLLMIPTKIRRRVAEECIKAEAYEPSRDALLSLLTLDSLLYRITGSKSIEYNGGSHVKHRLTRYHDFFVNRISPGERVVDIGCGRGEVAYEIVSKAGGVVTGIDRNTDWLAYAKEAFKHSSLDFICGDVLEFLPTQPYDTVIMSNVLEHIENRIAFLDKVKQQIQPGRFLLRVPMFNRDWRVPLRKELGLPYFLDDTHYIEYTQESFEQEMEEAAGLRITHMEIRWGEIWAEVIPDA
ncbi:class I SAM-dependent methyltransferase [Thermodesulfobacteriota bacterium]